MRYVSISLSLLQNKTLQDYFLEMDKFEATIVYSYFTLTFCM